MKNVVGVLIMLLMTGAARAADRTYGEVLNEERIRAVVASELEGLQARTSQAKVRIDKGMFEWSVERIAPLRPHNPDLEKAEDELREGYRGFLDGLVTYNRAGSEVAVVSAKTASDYLGSARRCGVVPCSPSCCEFCDPCQ